MVFRNNIVENLNKKNKKKDFLKFNERIIAVNILDEILIKKNSLLHLKNRKDFFPKKLPLKIKARSFGIVKKVLRNLSSIDNLISKYLKKDPNLRFKNFLRVCFSEIIFDKIPPYASVDMIIKTLKNERKLRYYKNLGNAICRKFVKDFEKGIILKNFSFPIEFEKNLSKIYGKEVVSNISKIFQSECPLDISLKNSSMTEKYYNVFNAIKLSDQSLRLSRNIQISSLPGFKEGDWWVQDFSSSLPIRLLGEIKGKSVLDLCSAPGGKTMQLCSLGANVTSVDFSKRRLEKLKENLKRTNLEAKIINENILNLKLEKLFDIVLVDAPCSSSGTLRKNVDLPYLNFKNHFLSLLDIQKNILMKSINWVKKGGTLIYCTCSLFPEEGEEIIDDILSKTTIIKQKKIDINLNGFDKSWINKSGSIRLRPDYLSEIGGMDGFFISFLEKV